MVSGNEMVDNLFNDESVGSIEFTIKVTNPKHGMTNTEYVGMLNFIQAAFNGTAVEQTDFRFNFRLTQNDIDKIEYGPCGNTSEENATIVYAFYTPEYGRIIACSACGEGLA